MIQLFNNQIVLNKEAVGLGNVDNTSDNAKPISTATQTALATKEETTTALDYGYKVWTSDLALFNNGFALASGQLYTYRIYIKQTITVTDIAYYITAGMGMSNCYIALYNSSGNLLGQSVDESINWLSSGAKVSNIPTQTLTPGSYDIAFWCGGSATQPQLFRNAASNIINFGLTGSAIRSATTSNIGLTTTAPATLGTKTANGIGFFFMLK